MWDTLSPLKKDAPQVTVSSLINQLYNWGLYLAKGLVESLLFESVKAKKHLK